MHSIPKKIEKLGDRRCMTNSSYLKQQSPKNCDECGERAHTTDSRQMKGYVWRRYRCECGKMWTTIEVRHEDSTVAVHRNHVAQQVLAVKDMFSAQLDLIIEKLQSP
jgi:hypothetical protein